MKTHLTFLASVFLVTQILAQSQPKLVVGVVVDQMRMDYIYRYWNHFDEGGFKRLMGEGFACKNAHFNYIPTYTAPGHASIYTGAAPMDHGIIANDWFDKSSGEMVYCVSDDGVSSVGTETKAGKMSPHRMLAPSMGDAIKISSQFRGKSIGISIKDRGAILPAGHSADAAYWMDYTSGDFITSDYYMEKLPKWLQSFNAKNHPDNLASGGWIPLLSIDKYTESTPDDTPYEKVYNPNGKPVFPYDLPTLIKERGYYAFASSPFGNSVLTMLAEEVLVNEELGMDDHLDLLAISYSTPDIIGHSFGPQSIEIQDTYIRLDAEISKLLITLDKRVGEGNYTLFLTADHAAAQVPAYMMDNRVPAGYFDDEAFVNGLTAHLNAEFGEGPWIKSYSNQQLFLNRELISENGTSLELMYQTVEQFSLQFEGVAGILSKEKFQCSIAENQFAAMAKRGWNQQRSGDIMVQYLPGWMEYGHQGTTHGSSYNYDSHVPLIFFGFGVNQGVELNPVYITQIAPTISLITSTAFPELSDHKPVLNVIKR